MKHTTPRSSTVMHWRSLVATAVHLLDGLKSPHLNVGEEKRAVREQTRLSPLSNRLVDQLAPLLSGACKRLHRASFFARQAIRRSKGRQSPSQFDLGPFVHVIKASRGLPAQLRTPASCWC
jgi:hypothetical protein